jgi:hypothetical protein
LNARALAARRHGSAEFPLVPIVAYGFCALCIAARGEMRLHASGEKLPAPLVFFTSNPTNQDA